MKFLTEVQMRELLPAEEAALPTPIPTQVVSSEEYFPPRQTGEQKEFEARLLAKADALAAKQGLSRRRFFETAAGMAGSFVAMKQGYGGGFRGSPPPGAPPGRAGRRARALARRRVRGRHTHQLRG